MTTTSPIRVMIVDDLETVRDSLKIFLLTFKDLEVVAEASHGEQAINLCAQLQPDVVLLDTVMPGLNGPTTAKALREVCSTTKVLVLTTYLAEELAQQALQEGAVGYLFKDAPPEEIVAAIRAAHGNHSI